MDEDNLRPVGPLEEGGTDKEAKEKLVSEGRSRSVKYKGRVQSEHREEAGERGKLTN